jgi:hypothetical protein
METGLLQIWLNKCGGSPRICNPDCGVTSVMAAKNPETNIRCGMQKWNAAVKRMDSFLKSSGIPLGPADVDYWAMAQMWTGIGGGASPALLKASGARDMDQLINWCRNNPAALFDLENRGKFGTQRAGQIAWRVVYAKALAEAAYAADSSGFTAPVVGIGVGLLAAVAGYFIARRYL